MIIQHTLSLRCQASRWLSGAFPQSLPSFQKCQKSLPDHPAPSHRQRKIQQKATKQFNIQIDNNNGQLVTACIVHPADSANFKGVTSNKLCSGLTGSCFESPAKRHHTRGTLAVVLRDHKTTGETENRIDDFIELPDSKKMFIATKTLKELFD
jgi:hypothetical protein